jgi:hypothetical protein
MNQTLVNHGRGQIQGSGATAGCDVAARESHLPEETGYLNETAGMLESIVADLESRLESVVSPMPPSAGQKGESIDSFRVPAAEKIRVARRRIDDCITRLQSLRDRVEV